KAFDVKFQSESGSSEYVWSTSWGVSTRMIGGLVMTHGDDNGMRIPPLLAPIELVIVPIYKTDEERSQVIEAGKRLVTSLHEWERRRPGQLRVHLDARDGVKPGARRTAFVNPSATTSSARSWTAKAPSCTRGGVEARSAKPRSRRRRRPPSACCRTRNSGPRMRPRVA